jgi:hypothetical protein
MDSGLMPAFPLDDGSRFVLNEALEFCDLASCVVDGAARVAVKYTVDGEVLPVSLDGIDEVLDQGEHLIEVWQDEMPRRGLNIDCRLEAAAS